MCVCVCVSICAQSYTTLCDPMHCSPPGSSVHEIFQARILGQVDISYSRGSLRSREQNYIFCISCIGWWPDGTVVKNPPANAVDVGSIPGLGKAPGGSHANPLQYSCLENPMDRGDCWATVHGGHKESDTTDWLSVHTYTHTHTILPWEKTQFKKTQVLQYSL